MLIVFLNDAATTEIYTLSLHDALPIYDGRRVTDDVGLCGTCRWVRIVTNRRASVSARAHRDRKSTRLNSSHVEISYAVFCLKKKKVSNTASTPTPSICAINSAYRTHSY